MQTRSKSKQRFESESEKSWESGSEEEVKKINYLSTNLIYNPNINVSNVKIEEITE